MGENKMLSVFSLFAVVLISASSFAQTFDANMVDAAARKSKSDSIMFRQESYEEEMQRRAYEEEMQRRAYEEEMQRRAYEEEMRRRAEYEEEMRKKAYEEEMRRREEALRPVNLFGNSVKIFAEVNGEIITSSDMQDRVNAFVVTTQIPVNDQTKNMIIEKVLQSAIDEKLKLQEAQKNSIKISPEELDVGMVNFAKSNNISVEQLKQVLKKAQVSEDVFRSQMKAEMVWSRLVQKKAAQNAIISRNEIKSAMETMEKDIQKHKFLVSEIVISKEKAKGIEQLVENLRQDPRFELYAMQFSEGLSAKNGGHIGWVNKGQLTEPLDKVLLNMKEGEISNPILLGKNYYILKLEKVYVPGSDKAPVVDETQVRKMLENKKIEEIAEKYIRDLRNKAIINRKA